VNDSLTIVVDAIAASSVASSTPISVPRSDRDASVITYDVPFQSGFFRTLAPRSEAASFLSFYFSRKPSSTEQRVTSASRQEVHFMSRISSIRELQDGWFGNQSIAPSPSLISWVEANCRAFMTAPVSIIPVADGSIALQWADKRNEYTAELYDDGRMVFLVDDLESDNMTEAETQLDVGALSRFIASGNLG
jgi:hypothetical protein